MVAHVLLLLHNPHVQLICLGSNSTPRGNKLCAPQFSIHILVYYSMIILICRLFWLHKTGKPNVQLPVANSGEWILYIAFVSPSFFFFVKPAPNNDNKEMLNLPKTKCNCLTWLRLRKNWKYQRKAKTQLRGMWILLVEIRTACRTII